MFNSIRVFRPARLLTRCSSSLTLMLSSPPGWYQCLGHLWRLQCCCFSLALRLMHSIMHGRQGINLISFSVIGTTHQSFPGDQIHVTTVSGCPNTNCYDVLTCSIDFRKSFFFLSIYMGKKVISVSILDLGFRALRCTYNLQR